MVPHKRRRVSEGNIRSPWRCIYVQSQNRIEGGPHSLDSNNSADEFPEKSKDAQKTSVSSLQSGLREKDSHSKHTKFPTSNGSNTNKTKASEEQPKDKKSKGDHRIIWNEPIAPCIECQTIVLSRDQNYKQCLPDGAQRSTEGASGFDHVSLSYPGTELVERFALAIPSKKDDYDPLQDLRATATCIVEFCLGGSTGKPLGDMTSGILRGIIKSSKKRNIEELKECVQKFNEILSNIRPQLNCTTNHVKAMVSEPTFLYHVLEQAYARTVAPSVDMLRSYKGESRDSFAILTVTDLFLVGFSNYVYGEVKHNLVTDFIKEAGIKPHHTFLDMGSGTGNVVLQVAGQTLCESYGIEKMDNPAKLAEKQKNEFLSRMRYYGQPVGKVGLKHGDFLEDEEIHHVLKRADVIFVVISLRSFVPIDRRPPSSRRVNSIENIFKAKEDSAHQNGLIGLLHLCVVSGGKFRNEIVNSCLRELELLQKGSFPVWHDEYYGFADFMRSACSCLMQLAVNHEDVRHSILESMWRLTRIMITGIVRIEGAPASLYEECALAIMVSITNAAPEVHAPHIEELCSIMNIVFAEQTSFDNGIYSGAFSFELLEILLRLVRHCLTGYYAVDEVETRDFMGVWDGLLQGRPYSTQAKVDEISGSIFRLLWTSWNKYAFSDTYLDTEISMGLLPLLMQCCTLCSLSSRELKDEIVRDFTKFIEETTCDFSELSNIGVLVAGNQSLTKTALFSFVNTLQTTVDKETDLSTLEIIHGNCIAGIAALVHILKPKQAVEIALPALTRKLSESVSDSLKEYMWQCLASIVLSSGVDVFKEVLSFVGLLLTKDPRFADLYLEGILALFIERSSLSQEGDANASSDLYQLALILKNICDLESFKPHINPTDDLVLLFRNFWLNCVLFVLGPNGEWPKEWVSALLSIALKTPPLTLGKEKRNLEADLLSNSVLRANVRPQIFAKCQSNLSACLPKKTSEMKNLSQPLVLRLYLRAKQLGRTSLFASLVALFKNSASRLQKVRAFASKYAVKIMEIVPSLLWDRKLMYILLDMVQYLDKANYNSTEREELLRRKIGFALQYVDESEKQQAAADFMKLCSALVSISIKRSVGETTALLQSYLIDLHFNHPDLVLGTSSDIVNFLGSFCNDKDVAFDIIKSLNSRAQFIGEAIGITRTMALCKGISDSEARRQVATMFKQEIKEMAAKAGQEGFIQKLNPVLHRAAALIVSNEEFDDELLHLICWTPLLVFHPDSVVVAISVWQWIMSSRPELNSRMLSDLIALWEWTVYNSKGIYEHEKSSMNPFMNKMTYTPSKKPVQDSDSSVAHLNLVRFLESRFKPSLLYNKEHIWLYLKLLQVAFTNFRVARVSGAIWETRFIFLHLGARVGEELELMGEQSALFAYLYTYNGTLDWFSVAPSWIAYENQDSTLILKFHNLVKAVKVDRCLRLLSHSPVSTAFGLALPTTSLIDFNDAQSLLMLLLESEIAHIRIWQTALGDNKDWGGLQNPRDKELKLNQLAKVAWSINPAIAVQFIKRFLGYTEAVESELAVLCGKYPASLLNCKEALPIFLKAMMEKENENMRLILYWTSVSPITAITLLGPQYKSHPWVLQYAVHVLEYFPIETVFFYIPQMVQALRYDASGYVEHFILQAAKVSQLFAHQIIWNMNANMFKIVKEGKHEEKMIPDGIKPALDRIIEKIVTGLSGSDKEFYEREFAFFDEVTGISGKLKPYISKSKAEKKKKIDEEMRKIKVDPGVYLPSNPESTVVDIDYDSGRPLQSHAKAPFMATFKIQRDGELDKKRDAPKKELLWQSAIFKVGDDCRQDILALQLISILKSIFVKAGLDLYVYPYRIVATAPGCGVIEVIPKSISRDMMGREKVNSLPNYFLEKFGTSDSFSFRKAQESFIRSLAAYSLILYLIQIKDRHNGNIMFDDVGHIVHIDFGFILDIAPGGIEFEASPFKLTTEMINVMDGDANTPAYKLFSELIVKAYLAVRPYAEEIVQMVALMLDSGLPCFKGEQTIKKLRDRFQLGRPDKSAAEFMVNQIRLSHENQFR
ncbi:phosphatidylinositol-4- kinase [Chytridiales sp. JEL 0842]|nr:phosphatidylinositol-4- kinase [Chytridiales sp. JEL 0842]